MTFPFTHPVSEQIWRLHYRHQFDDGVDETSIEESWRRVAAAAAGVEKNNKDHWENTFYDILRDFKFLPGGRILANAGTQKAGTLMNCFVLPINATSTDAIFASLRETATCLEKGGGLGFDFSSITPRGDSVNESGRISCGPLALMHLCDSLSGLVSMDNRPAAMLASLRCDHPDVFSFLDAKREPGALSHFNLSVLITDHFMLALRAHDDITLRATEREPGQSVRAQSIWEDIARAAHATADPGVLFVDRINDWNNLWYCEHISATNPCGEIPLPMYGACNLGSINLTKFVDAPFEPTAQFDMEAIERVTSTAIRFLDNIVDIGNYPLEEQRRKALNSRRVGLGITGLADSLLMLGVDYSSELARDIASQIMQRICHVAYRTSVQLAEEKGSFPLLSNPRFCESKFVSNLPVDIQQSIKRTGIRNSQLLAIAPTGTISLLANNVSSGLEPLFDLDYKRTIQHSSLHSIDHSLEAHAWSLWRSMHGSNNEPPAVFRTATQVSAADQLKMQAALQKHVDNAISKTVRLSADCSESAIMQTFQMAYDLGLKGCTVYRHGVSCGHVMNSQ